MKIVLIVVGVLVLLVVAFIVWRIIATARAGERLKTGILAQIAPVTEALRAGREPDAALIQLLAASALTRNALFDELLALNRTELFPEPYRSAEARAESDMVYWLCHPNELGCPPDAIEFVTKAIRDGGPPVGHVDYYIFRFRTNPPHWASDDGWMAGVAGPYKPGGAPTVGALGTFSHFQKHESNSADELVEYCHQRMVREGEYPKLG
jgi:hypothetical protein